MLKTISTITACTLEDESMKKKDQVSIKTFLHKALIDPDKETTLYNA
jgi:hypothetical protein